MAVVEQLGDDKMVGSIAACFHLALVFAIKHLHFFFKLLFLFIF